MAKSDYISDNLIHFREQFRGRRPNINKAMGSYNVNPNDGELEKNEVSPVSNAFDNNNLTLDINSVSKDIDNSTQNISSNSSKMNTSLNDNNDRSKIYTPASSLATVNNKASIENNFFNQERELRDVGERLRREQAYLQVKLEEYDLALKEAKLFSNTVETLIAEYEKMSAIKNSEDARKLEHLRIRYFQAQGRFAAINTSSTNNVASMNNNLLEQPSKLDKYLLPAVIAGGVVLLSIVLICLF